MNSFHEAHAGEIVFSTREIARRAAPRSPATRFDVNDTIYLRVYQEASAENLYRRNGRECRRSYSGFGRRDRMIRARKVGTQEWFTLKYGIMDQDIWIEDTSFPLTFDGDIVSLYDRRPLDVPGPETDPRFQWVHGVVPTLSPGENQVEFEALYRCNMDTENAVTVGRGTMTVRVNQRSIADMQRRSTVQFGRNMLPASAQSQMQAGVASYFGSPWEVTHAIAVGPWTVAYHPINRLPVSRQIDGWAFLRNRQTNGCAVVNTGFQQEARSRSAFHSAVSSTGVGGGPPQSIACSVVPRR